MPTRRQFLASACLAATTPGALAAAAKPLLQIGLAADAQYADAEAKGTRFYRASIEKLGSAVTHFNALPLDFCVHLGDLIDRQWSSFDRITAPLAQSRHTFYHLLGNHDFSVLSEEKPRVPERIGLQKRYYQMERNGFRFLFLDTTEVSLYAHPDGSLEARQGEAELQRVQALKLPQAKDWNSGMGGNQLQWLERSLTAAKGANQRVIIFAHHPVAPEGVHDLWNSSQVLGLMAEHRHVAAWINGHNHAGGYANIDGAHFVTMHGMVETADSNAFATAAVFNDRLLISGQGREPSRELVFRA